MPVTPLVVPTDNVDDVTSASIFNEMQKPVNTLNEHMVGTTGNGATRHTDAMIDATALPESTTPTQAPSTQHVFNDGTYAALSAFLGAFSGTGAIAKLAAAAAAKTYFAALALLAAHSHADATTGGQLVQANTHQSPDTDVATTSLHHTLGTGATQAAAGNHLHAGVYAPVGGAGTSGTWPISVSGSAATAATAGSATTAGNVTGTVAVGNGGTGATTAAAAQTALGVPSTAGTGASGTWPISVTGNAATATSATALTAPIAYTGAIVDYKPATSASAGTIVVGAGGAYSDSNGLTVGPLNQQNATMPTQPTGTNVQYVGVSLAVTTGAPVVTPGTVGASLGAITPPLLPVGNKPNAMVIWRGATTLPSGIIAAADITDLRIPGGGGGGGAGGTDTAVRSDTHVLLNGPSAVLTGGVDATNPASNIAISMAGLRDSVTDVDLGNLLGDYISGNVVGGIQAVGAQLRLAASPASAVRIRHAGRQRQIAASALSPTSASGGADRWSLYADLTATGTGAFTVDIALASSFAPTTYQIELARVWWDGTQWQTQLIDYNHILPALPATAIAPLYLNSGAWNGTAMGTAGSFLPMPGAPSVTFYAPTTMKLHGWWQGFFTQSASAANINLYFSIDGASQNPTINTSSVPASAVLWFAWQYDFVLPAGAHTLSMTYFNGGGGLTASLVTAAFGGILTR